MASGNRAPKQWCLGKSETVNSFENWRQNLVYTLTLDQNFAPFLTEGATWLKHSRDNPMRGFTNDGETVQATARRTAQQKVSMLELMLGQIANYCPVIARNTIVKKSTSINSIWQSIRAHYGFQSTGAHFLDISDIKLLPDERPEELFERLTAFVEDNLLMTNGGITHHGETISQDEEVTPTLENIIVAIWLQLIHKDLPKLVKQRYGTELRSRTIASIKPEISQALDSLLEEIHSNDTRVMRSDSHQQVEPAMRQKRISSRPKPVKICPLCKQANRSFNHFLSQCRYLPEADRRYITTARRIADILDIENGLESEEDDAIVQDIITEPMNPNSARRVQVCQSPYIDVYVGHHTPRFTIDCGATANLIKQSTADRLKLKVTPSSQSAGQADGMSKLHVIGETRFTAQRGDHYLTFDGLVVKDLDVEVLAGVPFMERNDIHTRPHKRLVYIGDKSAFKYGSSDCPLSPSARRVSILRAPAKTSTVWPGDYIEVQIPKEMMLDDNPTEYAIEPHILGKANMLWPTPAILSGMSGIIRLPNATREPQVIKGHEHLCQIRHVFTPPLESFVNERPLVSKDTSTKVMYSKDVSIDPDHIMPPATKKEFEMLNEEFDTVFNPTDGCYNGSIGPFKAVVNMGPTQPPQRKGRLPLYPRDRLTQLQSKMDELENMGVLVRPESVGISVEYLNPSFLVNKPSGGTRLVTAFGEVGQYTKPQPALMPSIETTLYNIGQWKYIVTTDLSSAFYQIPLAPESMKYCGTVTPFKGSRVYARCAMGMPGSETALEELMSRVLGNLIADGAVTKLADDLYIGANSFDKLLSNWRLVLSALSSAGLRLSASKTIICPNTATILGWKWSNGTLQAGPHRIASLARCGKPKSVKDMRSFLGAYKFISRVLPNCSDILSPLEAVVAGRQSRELISWSDDLEKAFHYAQSKLESCKTITIPWPSDQLWIVTDAASKDPGIGATLYVSRNDKIFLGGFFSAKLKNHQTQWLPCEIEALAIASATKHYSPYLVQSQSKACILTDSKPCVQAYERLCRGEFSASPRLSTFLSTASRYQTNIRHLAGNVNVPSDFASRNALPCDAPECQICSFIRSTEKSVVLRISSNEILSGNTKLPFTTRSTWRSIQSECPDLRRTHAHLSQGTRPSKKANNIKDVKRYLTVARIARDGLLVTCRSEALIGCKECIIVPRQILHGLLTVLHIRLDHPSAHQLKTIFTRYFYALDLDHAISDVSNGCHLCCSLRKLPAHSEEQSSVEPPEALGVMFAADVMRRNLQFILVIREQISSYTLSSIIPDEQKDTLREALIRMCIELRPLEGPPCVIRTDCSASFTSLVDDPALNRHSIAIEIGRAKNKNKNPVAERAVQELESELLRNDPLGGHLSPLTLSIATARLNSRVRSYGMSAREIWLQRDQFTNKPIPVNDLKIILERKKQRDNNHIASEQSKSHGNPRRTADIVEVGDIVYLYSDGNKLKARNRYIVTTVEGNWCNVRKFTGSQLRNTSYRVKLADCYKVPTTFSTSPTHENIHTDDDEDEYIPPSSTQQQHTIHKEHVDAPPNIPFQLSTIPYEEPLRQDLHRVHEDAKDLVSSDRPDDSYVSQTATHETVNTTTEQLNIPLRRSTRQRRPPSYLQDYVK